MRQNSNARRWIKARFAAWGGVCCLLLLFVGMGEAQTRNPKLSTQEKLAFGSFVDGFIEGNMKRSDVPGLAFVAVKDGEILYMRGYGVAKKGGEAVQPERTIFRLGSISKLLTATAALQMVANERLEMDRDVNEYLRNWSLPHTFTPITLRHLLSHTAGLDERRTLISAPSSKDEIAFAKQMPTLMPARAFPPDSAYSYSNMGYALVGSIVERYSRQPFHRVIEKKILTPLEMNSSGFTLTASEQQRLAQGYDATGGEVPYRYYYIAPAISFSSTAADMAHFMIAQLQYGKYKRRYILGEKYASGLFTIQFSPDPHINGTALGYYQYRSKGFLAHHGDIDGFSSLLVLSPEENFGFFMVANAEHFDFRDSLAEALLDRFTSLSPDRRPLSRGPEGALSSLEGAYRHNRISRHTAEKAFGILGEQIGVKVVPGGVQLDLPSSLGGGTESWQATANPLFFQREGGKSRLIFTTDDRGAVQSLTRNSVYMTYDKLPWRESLFAQKGQLLLFACCSLLALGGLLLSFAMNRGRLPWEREGAMVELWVLSSVFSISQLLFALGLWVSKDLYSALFAYTIPFRVKALFLIPILGCLLLLWFWVRYITYLLNPFYNFIEKLVLLLLGLVGCWWVLFLMDWNLFGFRF